MNSPEKVPTGRGESLVKLPLVVCPSQILGPHHQDRPARPVRVLLHAAQRAGLPR